MVKKVAIITARGGSKRIPRKNIRNFCGVPIISYSINAATDSGLFDEVMVSTDDEEIASIARNAGAKVPFLRSELNSNDTAGTADVIAEVIESYRSRKIFFDELCCIYPTAPFVTGNLLSESYQLFKKGKFSVLLPVIQFSYPIQRSLRIVGENKGEMLWPENYHKRSQDLEPIFHDVGQFYWIQSEHILQDKRLFGENTGTIKISELQAQDIDNEEDWRLAEIKYSMITGSKG